MKTTIDLKLGHFFSSSTHFFLWLDYTRQLSIIYKSQFECSFVLEIKLKTPTSTLWHFKCFCLTGEILIF